jgi:hypothetical protein
VLWVGDVLRFPVVNGVVGLLGREFRTGCDSPRGLIKIRGANHLLKLFVAGRNTPDPQVTRRRL